MDLPVRVRSKNQNSTSTTIKAVTIVNAWLVRNAKPCSSPVKSLNAAAVKMKRSPSSKFCSPGPITNRTMPFMRNITPTEAMRKTTGGALWTRWCR